MKKTVLWMVVCLSAAGLCAGDGIREVEIYSEPPDAKGLQIFMVRLRADKTHTCDQVVFDCVLHQEFPWETSTGEKKIKVHEPEVFTYRRNDVKLVEDLDCCIDFRVPVGIKNLKEKFGLTAFNTNYPVTVSRMKISGVISNAPAWSFETVPDGIHEIAAAPASAKTAPGEPVQKKPSTR